MFNQEIITIKYNISDITLVIYFNENDSYGSIVSYLDENRLQRAFFNRYDMKEIKSKSEYERLVKYYTKKRLK